MADQNKKGLAITSLIFGFSALFLLLGVFAAVPGIIFGHLARSRAINYPHEYVGSRIAMLGLIMSYLSIAITVLLIATADHLRENGDLVPLLDTFDESTTLSHYAVTVLDRLPFTYRPDK